MKKIILFIAGIFVAFFITDRLVALMLDNVYQHNTSGNTSGKLTYVLHQNKNFDALLFGASKITHNVMPDSLGENYYNLGFGGTSILFQYCLLSILEQNKKLPKKIILQVEESDYFVSENSLKDSTHLNDNFSHLKYYYDKCAVIKGLIDSSSTSAKYFYCLKSFQFNGNFSSMMLNFFQLKKNKTNSNGFDPFYYKPSDSLKVLLLAEQTKKNIPLIRTHSNHRAFYYLNKFVEKCNANHVQILCYFSPMFGGNEKIYPYKFFLHLHLAALGLHFIDFNLPENKINEFDNSKYWFDAVHLNTKGASVLSHHLKHWLVLQK